MYFAKEKESFTVILFIALLAENVGNYVQCSIGNFNNCCSTLHIV